MKKVYLILAATVGMTITSCTTNDFVGEVATTPEEVVNDGSIRFGFKMKSATRADLYGSDAADKLGGEFIVLGVKGDGTGIDQTNVFNSYTVQWTANTAGKTESNTADWEYVGKSNYFPLAGDQAIKYWDYSATAYDFAAYSVGKGNTLVTTDGELGDNKIKASEITYAYTDNTDPLDPVLKTTSFTLKGSRADLTECYITDMKTVGKSNYKKEVELEFRSLASKVRMAIYETVPGYSVKDVFFYSEDQGATIAPGSYASSGQATLIGEAFYSGGEYLVTYPTIGSANSGGASTDYNKAHVSMTPTGVTGTSENFGTLNYTTGEDALAGGSSIYLKRASNDPSFAGTGTYYKTVLPKEDGTVLEMCVDYTLVSTDGSAEEITVHGAKAFVPRVYTKWMPNYAYTYIFKISDNTNGYTNPNGEDPAGLFPITFDAIVLDSEETGHQTTITTVATPSITTYQKGHVYSTTNSYDNTKMIYVQVQNDGTLITDLNSKDGEDKYDKAFFYKLSAEKTEADVMDALNIRTSGLAAVVVGRNGLTLTPATIDCDITAIPGEDGNDIEVAAGKAAELDPDASGTYAFVYLVSTGSSEWVYTAEQLTSAGAPANFTTEYYKQTAPNTFTLCGAGDYVQDNYYYKRYQDLNNVYAVKVIKVQ